MYWQLDFMTSEKLEIIKTADGSPSVHCSEHNESTHSIHGALQETEHHYITPCLRQRDDYPQVINILEMGFGIGHGYGLTANFLKDNPFKFYSFEKNKDFIHFAKSIYPSLKNLKEIKLGSLLSLIHI